MRTIPLAGTSGPANDMSISAPLLKASLMASTSENSPLTTLTFGLSWVDCGNFDGFRAYNVS